MVCPLRMNLWRGVAVVSLGLGVLECEAADPEGAFAFASRTEAELTFSTLMDPGLVSTQIAPPLFTTEIGTTIPLGYAPPPPGVSQERPGASATWRSPRVATEASTAVYESYTPPSTSYVRPISRSITNATSQPAQPTGTGNIPEGSTTRSGQPTTNAVPGLRPPGR